MPTVDGLGVVSLRVLEPIRPLLYLHPPAWADPELPRRRLSLPLSHTHTARKRAPHSDDGNGDDDGGDEDDDDRTG